MNPFSPNETALRGYATELADAVRKALKVELPANFVSVFCRHARRVGASSYEDLGQWAFLECLEAKRLGQDLDSEAVLRALDRIRHRIVRAARRDAQASGADPGATAGTVGSDPAEADRSAATDLVRDLLRSARLDPLQLTLLERRVLNRESASQVAADLGISRATAYRILSTGYAAIRKAMEDRGD